MILMTRSNLCFKILFFNTRDPNYTGPKNNKKNKKIVIAIYTIIFFRLNELLQKIVEPVRRRIIDAMPGHSTEGRGAR